MNARPVVRNRGERSGGGVGKSGKERRRIGCKPSGVDRGDESDIVVGPFESVLVAKPQTLYPIPRNQIEPGDFGVARVWPDEAVTCVGKVRLKELS